MHLLVEFTWLAPHFLVDEFCTPLTTFTPPVPAQQGVKQSRFLSVCLSVEEKILKQLRYVVIRNEKSTITTFELLFEGHSADSAIYDLWELQIQSFLISYYSSPTPPL